MPRKPKAEVTSHEDRQPDGRFTGGNKIWLLSRETSGRKPSYADQGSLFAAACRYFEWVAETPLQEAKPFAYEGEVTIAQIDKMRPMTIKALCLFLGISHETWRGWQTVGHDLYRPDLVEDIERIEAIIYVWKFDGAAAGLLNQAIIARDLGLSEKTELSNPDGTLAARSLDASKLTTQTLRELMGVLSGIAPETDEGGSSRD